MKNSLDRLFVKNIIKTAFIITVIVGAALYGAKAYLPEKFTDGYVVGSFLTIANLFFMKQFVIFFTSGDKKNLLKALMTIAGLIGTVVGLAFVVFFKIGNPMAVIIGFTVVLIVMMVGSVSLFKQYDKEMKEKQG
ncbi:MAG: hypothetical protein WCX65_04165 [bacterium]